MLEINRKQGDFSDEAEPKPVVGSEDLTPLPLAQLTRWAAWTSPSMALSEGLHMQRRQCLRVRLVRLADSAWHGGRDVAA